MEHTGIIVLVLSVSMAGVNGEVSDACLSCMIRHNPIDGCAEYSTYGQFCGPYRISPRYFQDCKAGVPDQDYERCTKDVNCATACVKAFMAKYEDSCLGHKRSYLGDNSYELTCADYARMHFGGGPDHCATDDDEQITEYLGNLTSLCGCLTVYGVCEEAGVTEGRKGTDDLLLVYIIVPICAVAVILTLICCVYQIRKYRKHNQQRRDNAEAHQCPADIYEAKKENEFIRNHYMLRSETATLPTASLATTPRPPFPLPASPHSNNPLQVDVANPQYEQAISVDAAYEMEITPSSSTERLATNQQQPPHMYENSLSLGQKTNNITEKSPRLPLPAPRNKTLPTDLEQ